MDNGAEEDRERDGSTSSSTTWRTCSSTWRMPGIELNGEGEPVWLTPHLRDPQPEGERCNLSSANYESVNALLICRYGDLLALVEDFDEMRASTRVLRQVPSRRASQAQTKPSGGSGKFKKTDEDSSSESSDVSYGNCLWSH